MEHIENDRKGVIDYPWLQQILDFISGISDLSDNSIVQGERSVTAMEKAINAANREESWAIAALCAFSMRDVLPPAATNLLDETLNSSILFKSSNLSIGSQHACSAREGLQGFMDGGIWRVELACLRSLRCDKCSASEESVLGSTVSILSQQNLPVALSRWTDAELPAECQEKSEEHCDGGGGHSAASQAAAHAGARASLPSCTLRTDQQTDPEQPAAAAAARPQRLTPPLLRGRLSRPPPPVAAPCEPVLRPKGPGYTPLAAATQQGRAELVALLLAAGADPARACAGAAGRRPTPLHVAAAAGAAHVARILLAGGAPAAAVDGRGLTPLQVHDRCRAAAGWLRAGNRLVPRT
jgi:hypothetical protein